MKIRVTVKYLVSSVFSLFLTACSPIDSTKPFDEQQAAVLVRRIVMYDPQDKGLRCDYHGRVNAKSTRT